MFGMCIHGGLIWRNHHTRGAYNQTLEQPKNIENIYMDIQIIPYFSITEPDNHDVAVALVVWSHTQSAYNLNSELETLEGTIVRECVRFWAALVDWPFCCGLIII